MDFIKNIKEDTILVIPNVLKGKILKFIDSLDRLVNIKILSLSDLKKHLYFDYNEEAILYLMDKYNYKYEVSRTLIDNMYFVEDREYSNSKLNELVELKKELDSLFLLKKDDLFLNFVSNKKIIVYGYDYIDDFNKKILSSFNNVNIIDDYVSNDKNIMVYECNTLLDEVNFVFSKIASMINSGLDINKIKITNVSDDYIHSLNTLSKLYNIPIDVSPSSSVTSSKIGRYFLNILDNSNDLASAIKSFQDEIIPTDITGGIYNKIISICNKYVELPYSYKSIKESIIYDLKNSSITSKSLENKVEVVSFYDNVFNDDEYVFLVGFNQGNAPIIYKDEDYISDNLKDEVNLTKTNVKNTLCKNAFVNKIKSINNLIITYKLKSISEDFYPSNLIKELNIEVVNSTLDTGYSEQYSKITLGKMLDELIKYDSKDNLLDKYYSSVSIPYMKYDNKFTGISSKSLLDKLNDKLLLSYSTIDNYYRCAFRYYIANVLKLDKYEETFKTFIGNLFHYVLSKCLDNDFNFDYEWDNYIKDKTLLVSEQFFLIKLKEELKLIIDEVKRLHMETGLTDYLLEHKIYIDKTRGIPVAFMGIVDKIMYKNTSGIDLISIIDYKTGNPNTNLFNTIYGIDMQLPVYLYLVKYSTLFNNPSFVGFYLQKILHGEITRGSSKTYLEQKKDNLKLVGYSTTDEANLSRFDPTYENSAFIKSMKISSKGFYSYAKVIEDKKINLLINLVNNKIDEAIDDILSAKFDINPKRIGTDLKGCSFCKFKDLCYMREEDIVNLKEYNDFSFLGGDDNA